MTGTPGRPGPEREMMLSGWHDWFGTFTGVALLAVAALPLAALAVWALARWRSATGTSPTCAWRTSTADVGIVYGTVPLVWMTMMPGSRAGEVTGRVSLLPLEDLLAMGATQVVGNLLVLAALGFFAPLRFVALASVPRILALAAGCSVLIETAQYVLQLDRVSSVDDVLLNTAGAGLAAVASRPWWCATSGASSDRPRSASTPGRRVDTAPGRCESSTVTVGHDEGIEEESCRSEPPPAP